MSVPDHWLLFCFELSLCIFENMIRLHNERRLISSIHVNLKLKIRQSPIHLPYTFIVISALIMESLLVFMTRRTASIFPWLTFHF